VQIVGIIHISAGNCFGVLGSPKAARDNVVAQSICNYRANDRENVTPI